MREMNSTGIVWCPSIPSDWELRRVKDCFYISKVKAGTNNPVVLKLARSGVRVKDVTVNGGQMAESYDDYNPVQVGDLLLNPMDLYSGANCNVSEVEGVISPAYVNLRAKETLNPYYFDYYFKIQYWTMAMFAHGKGVSYDNRWTINAESVKAYELPFPSVSEQNAIVDIIKRKCTQIDALISNAQQQIEKLKAYKQSVITETVTKGLDPDVQMKDSGVEWIGEIPGNAELTKVSHLFNVILGKMVSPTKSKADETLESYFCAANVHFDDLQYDELKTMWFDSNEKETYLVQKGDLLVVEGGAGAGGSHIVEKDIENCYVQNSVMIVRRKKHVPEKWLYYIIYMLVKNNYIDYVCNKATIPHFTKDKLNNTPVVFYKEEQMKKMIAYLDHKCSQIDKLIALKQQKIEKLQQYKKSLIYEYVTGKKEV